MRAAAIPVVAHAEVSMCHMLQLLWVHRRVSVAHADMRARAFLQCTRREQRGV